MSQHLALAQADFLASAKVQLLQTILKARIMPSVDQPAAFADALSLSA